MARALDGIDRFTWQGGGFDAWLYGIVRNVVRELSRSRWRNAGPVTDECPATERGPEEHAVAADDTQVRARGVLPIERRGSRDPRAASAGRADVRRGRPAPRQAAWDDPHGAGEGVAAVAGGDGGGAPCSVTTSSVDQLVAVLDIAPPAPSAERIAALRARAEASRTARTRRAGRWFAVAAAVLALLAGAVVVRAVTGDGGETVEFDGQMVSPDGEPVAAELRVVATGIGRVVDLDTDVLPILPTGELYEVWFVGPGDSATTPNRISARTFHPDRGRSQQGPVRRRRESRSSTRRSRSPPSPATGTRGRLARRCCAPSSVDETVTVGGSGRGRHPPAVRHTADRVRRHAERAGEGAASGEAARRGDGGRRAAPARLGRLGAERRRHRARRRPSTPSPVRPRDVREAQAAAIEGRDGPDVREAMKTLRERSAELDRPGDRRARAGRPPAGTRRAQRPADGGRRQRHRRGAAAGGDPRFR